MSNVENDDPSEIAHRVRGANGQTANLFVVEQYDGTDVFKVDKDGYVTKQFDPDAASYIVWKSGSTYYAKSGVDGSVLTTDTTADVVINAALLAAQTAGGGDVVVKAGTHTTADTIRILAKTALRGSGRGTVLQRAAGEDFTMIDFEETNLWNTNMHFGQGLSDILLDGNADNSASGDGIHMGESVGDYDHAPDFGFIENVSIWNMTGWGIVAYDCYWNTLKRVWCHSCDIGGIQLTNCNQFYLIGVRVARGDGSPAQGVGISDQGEHNVYIGCDMSGCATGFYNAGRPRTFLNCWWEANTVDIDYAPGLSAATAMTLIDCSVDHAKITAGARVQFIGGHEYGTGTADYLTLSNENAIIRGIDTSGVRRKLLKLDSADQIVIGGNSAASPVEVVAICASDGTIVLNARTNLNNYLKLAQFTTANRPPLALFHDSPLIWVTDAASGQNLQMSVDGAWKVIPWTTGYGEGTATVVAGNTYVDAAHGLPVTPSINKIRLTPKDDLLGRSFNVTSVDATNIRITISTEDIIDHTFGWGVF